MRAAGSTWGPGAALSLQRADGAPLFERPRRRGQSLSAATVAHGGRLTCGWEGHGGGPGSASPPR
eukprot:2806193-Pyramimonas_sp.AAC.1